MDILRYSLDVSTAVLHLADLLYISSGIFMTPWTGMILGTERTENQKIAGLKMTNDRHSNCDLAEERSTVLDDHFGRRWHNLIGSTSQSDTLIPRRQLNPQNVYTVALAPTLSRTVFLYEEGTTCIVKR